MGKGQQNIQFVDKTIYGRLSDCEAHIHFLETAVRSYYDIDTIYYKQAVAELRVLVADNTKKNNGLIIDLMDDLDLKYEFDYSDKKVTLRTFMLELGGFLNRKKFTKAELIREIAQYEGSSHESKSVPDHLAIGHSFKINGTSAHIMQVMIDAKYVVGASREFIKYMADNHGYKPKYLRYDT